MAFLTAVILVFLLWLLLDETDQPRLWTEWEDSAKDFACILKGGTVKGGSAASGMQGGDPHNQAMHGPSWHYGTN